MMVLGNRLMTGIGCLVHFALCYCLFVVIVIIVLFIQVYSVSLLVLLNQWFSTAHSLRTVVGLLVFPYSYAVFI